MKKTLALTTLYALILTITSCHKHEIIIEPEVVVTGTDINVLFKQNLEDIKVIEPFDVEKGINYALLDRATVKIEELNYNDVNGNKITGKVELTFAEIYDRGTMLITNKPTSATTNLWDSNKGIEENDGLHLLQSKGQILINVTQNNESLIPLDETTPIEYTVIIPNKLTENQIDKVVGFLPKFISNMNDTDLNWTDDYYNYSHADELLSYMEMYCRNLGWNAFLYPTIHYNKQKASKKSFEKPIGLDNNNSRIFIAVENYTNVLATEQTLIPDGIKAHYILVVGNNDIFKYAIKQSQTTVADEKIVFKAEELQDATSNELKNIVNRLP